MAQGIIRIDGKGTLDMYGTEDFTTSYAVNRLGEMESRSGGFSNTVTIPYTANNARILGSPEEILTESLTMYRQLTATLLVEGNPTEFGYLVVKSASTKGYEISYFFGNTDWFAKLKDKTLADIGVSDLDHLYSAGTVYASRQHTWEDGYIYPNIDWGKMTGDDTFDNFFPVLYTKWLFMRMMEYTGYTPKGDILENERFKTEFISYYGEGQYHSDEWAKKWGAKGALSAPQTITPTSTARVILNDDSVNGYDNGTNWDASAYEYTATEGEKVSIHYRIEMQPIPNIFVGWNVVKFDGASNISVANGILNNSNNGVFSEESVVEVILNAGEKVFMSINAATSAGVPSVDITNAFVEVTAKKDFILESQWENALRFGSIKCTDLFRMLFNQYALVFRTDNFSREIFFDYFDKVSENIPHAKDWSDKIDFSEAPKVTDASANYGRKSIFKYTGDDTDPFFEQNPDYGSGFISVDNQHLDPEKIIFESTFAPVYRRQVDTFLEAAYISLFDDEGKIQTCTPRVGYIVQSSSNLIVIAGQPVDPVQPAVYFSDLSFSALLEEYYETLRGMLKRPKMLTAVFRLRTPDITALDHTIPIRWNYAYFYLNLINQYNHTRTDSTIVELVMLS